MCASIKIGKGSETVGRPCAAAAMVARLRGSSDPDGHQLMPAWMAISDDWKKRARIIECVTLYGSSIAVKLRGIDRLI